MHVSATQIENFRRCQRYWAWGKIEKILRPPHQATALGHRVHEILEGYLKSDTKIDLSEAWQLGPQTRVFYPGKIAAALYKNIALLDQSEWLIETEFENTDIVPGVSLVGKIDVWWRDQNGDFHIIDHKTSSDPEKWGKKKDDLELDSQRILYSLVLGRDNLRNTTEFSLSYGSTNLEHKKNYVVTVGDTNAHIAALWGEHFRPLVLEMARLKKQGVRALELEPNTDACGLFGGCPYREHCGLSSAERMKGFIMGNSKLDEILAAAKAKNAEVAAAAPAPKNEAAINPPESATQAESASKLDGIIAAAKAKNAKVNGPRSASKTGKEAATPKIRTSKTNCECYSSTSVSPQLAMDIATLYGMAAMGSAGTTLEEEVGRVYDRICEQLEVSK